MSSLLIKNGRVVTLNDRADILEHGERLHRGLEDRRGRRDSRDTKHQADRVIDAGGKVVMPGLINAHHHLYSTFARGFSPPGKPAENFKEILEHLWWKLDHALDAEDVYYSALLAAARLHQARLHDDHRPPRLAVLPRRQPRPDREGVPRRRAERLSLLRGLRPQRRGRRHRGERAVHPEVRGVGRRPDHGALRPARLDDARREDAGAVRGDRAPRTARASTSTRRRTRSTSR